MQVIRQIIVDYEPLSMNLSSISGGISIALRLSASISSSVLKKQQFFVSF